jgi:hypothetical protein
MYGQKKPQSQKKKRSFGQLFGSASRENAFEKRLNVSGKMSYEQRLRHIGIICEQLREQYKKHEGASEFIKYLGFVDDIFLRVKEKNWSIEQTREEMIGQVMRDMDDLDQDLLDEILYQYDQISGDVLKIRETEDFLLDKYEHLSPQEYATFIRYVSEYFLIFSEALTHDLSLADTKKKVIEMRIELIAQQGNVSAEVLREIYSEYVRVLENYDIYVDPSSLKDQGIV